MSQYAKVDAAIAGYQARRISRDEAIAQIRAAIDVTEAGAADLVDVGLSFGARLARGKTGGAA